MFIPMMVLLLLVHFVDLTFYPANGHNSCMSMNYELLLLNHGMAFMPAIELHSINLTNNNNDIEGTQSIIKY